MGNEEHRIHYLAYGSNLHPLRLAERVPSARFLQAVRLERWRLHFHKRSADFSAKCDLRHTKNQADIAYGAIYSMDPAERPVLDRYEASGFGYDPVRVTVECDGRAMTCFTYSAHKDYVDSTLHPYSWYKDIVYLGARFHQFPEFYLEAIAGIPAIPDPDEKRHLLHAALIGRLEGAIQ